MNVLYYFGGFGVPRILWLCGKLFGFNELKSRFIGGKGMKKLQEVRRNLYGN